MLENGFTTSSIGFFLALITIPLILGDYGRKLMGLDKTIRFSITLDNNVISESIIISL